MNLIPFLTGGNSEAPHQALFFRKDDGVEWSARSDRWKLVAKERGERRELYDLQADIGESQNVIGKYRDVADRLAQSTKPGTQKTKHRGSLDTESTTS